MNEPVIEVSDLWFTFNGQPVLKDVNFTIRRGEFLAIIGPNGGGKTTLLKLIIGLLNPDQGKIRIFGQPPGSVTRRIGYVPQNVHINKDFPVTVRDVVLMGRLGSVRGWSGYSKADGRAAREALEKLAMWEFHDQRIGSLSGGQLQRVFIARALVTDPDILFMDEAMASIDAQGRSDLYHLLKELNQSKTIAVVSHDLMVLSSYVKSVACVNRNLLYHEAAEVTAEMLDMAYHCPVDLVAHGLPHRVLCQHEDERHD